MRRAARITAVRTAVALAAAALAVATIGAVAGCAPPAPSPSPPAAELPDGVTVELRQSRADVAARQASVRVTNRSDDEISIGAVSVDDPRFDEPAVRLVDRTSTLAPGVAVDVRVQLADVACDAPPDAVATVTLDFAVEGVAGAAERPLAEPVPFVDALHERECVRDRVLQAAEIDFGAFTPSPPGEPAELDLSIVPRQGAEAVRLVGIRETNLLTFARLGDAGIFVLDLDLDPDHDPGASGPVTVPLPVRPGRCDPHAVLEDKRGTVFRLLVEIDGEDGSFDLAASEELRGTLLDWVADWCGFGED